MPSDDVSRQRPSGIGIRRRAARACLCCRARKVRCDYVVVGRPCTNCKLDDSECVVQNSRRRKWPQLVNAELERQGAHQSRKDPSSGHCTGPSPSLLTPITTSVEPEIRSLSSTRSLNPLLWPCLEPSLPQSHQDELLSQVQNTALREGENFDETMAAESRDFLELAKFLDEGVTNASQKRNLLSWDDRVSAISSQGEVTSSWEISSDSQCSWPHTFFSSALFRETRPETQSPTASSTEASLSSISLSSVRTDSRTRLSENGGFLIFSCYHFVASNSLWMLGQDETKMLEQKGCLHLPKKAQLDEFIRGFFLYVHPTCPLLDEASFRSLYEGQLSTSIWPEPLPLCVLQAMIFAACPFVPSATLRNLGFSSVREARSHFYGVCDAILRIQNTEDHIIVAQCALLLTYYTPTIGDETNTQWLKTAIKSAREGRAHQYNSLSNNEVKGHKPASKRLWWCCILRDRIMSLGLRRPLEIKPKDFDFGLPSLSEEDLEGEIENSLVYSPSTKRVLVQLLTLLCDFAVVMNDILLLCYNPEPRRVKDPEQVRIVKQKVYQLEGWYDIAVSRFRELRQMPNVHKSASLFINAIYIYYFTAKACIYDRLMLEVSSHGDYGATSPYEAWHAVDEVDEAVRNITESFRQLEERDTTKYLSNTFVAFSALPFLWQEEKSKQGSQEEVEKDLVVYRELFRSLSGIYDMTDSVLERLRKARTVSETKGGGLLEYEILRYPLI